MHDERNPAIRGLYCRQRAVNLLRAEKLLDRAGKGWLLCTVPDNYNPNFRLIIRVRQRDMDAARIAFGDDLEVLL